MSRNASRRTRARSRTRDTLIVYQDILTKTSRCLTVTEIEKATGLNNTVANRCISELVRAKLLRRRYSASIRTELRTLLRLKGMTLLSIEREIGKTCNDTARKLGEAV